MLNIAIDLGSYSIKFLHFRIEKKAVVAKTTHEIILDLPEEGSIEEHDLWNTQLEHIQQYLETITEDFQVIMNFTSELVSTRFLSVPGKNKKRATMMVPFMIEEDLPFPISSCHYSETIEVKGDHCEVLAGVVKKEHFEDFYKLLYAHKLSPKILTNDVAIYESYMKSFFMNYPESFCILEFGHEATRGYFFHKGKLVSNHHSFVAGKVITEDISKTYNISLEEATIYKHQNAFVLTEGQLEDVNENQKDFAKLMDSTLQPLISEIRRWEIGFRVKHGVAVGEYFVCGGTSNINNFNNFLGVKLAANVSGFNPFMTCSDDHIDKDPKFRNKFAQACTLMQGMKQKNRFINFLKGEFSFKDNETIPLNSLAFMGVRVFALTFILIIVMLISHISLRGKNEEMTKIVAKKLQSGPVLNVSAREKKARQLNRSIGRILGKLKRQDKSVQQEVKSIQAAVKINALSALDAVVAIMSTVGSKAEIEKFYALSGENFEATIVSENLEDLQKLKRAFGETDRFEFFSDLDEQAKKLIVKGEEK